MNGRRSDLGEKVAKYYRQDFEGTTEGPHRVGDYRITRLWTHDSESDEYHAHYAVEQGTKLQMFENFSPFATWLATQFELSGDPTGPERRLKLRVAAIIVLGGFGLLAYLVFKNPQTDFPIGYVVTAIIGGAAGYMFGNWSKAAAP